MKMGNTVHFTWPGQWTTLSSSVRQAWWPKWPPSLSPSPSLPCRHIWRDEKLSWNSFGSELISCGAHGQAFCYSLQRISTTRRSHHIVSADRAEGAVCELLMALGLGVLFIILVGTRYFEQVSFGTGVVRVDWGIIIDMGEIIVARHLWEWCSVIIKASSSQF